MQLKIYHLLAPAGKLLARSVARLLVLSTQTASMNALDTATQVDLQEWSTTQLLLPLEHLVRPFKFPTCKIDNCCNKNDSLENALQWCNYNLFDSYTNVSSIEPFSPVYRRQQRDKTGSDDSSLFLSCKKLHKMFSRLFAKLDSVFHPSSAVYRPFIAVKCYFLIYVA